MSHTIDFLDEIARRAEIRPTSYAIAKHMGERYGWTRQSVQNYRRGQTVPDDTRGLDIATELELEPMYVLSCLNADRAADAELRSMWEKMAERARRTAAAVIVSAAGALVGWVGIPADSMAYASSGSGSMNQTSYTLHALLRRLRAWLAGLADEADALELA